MICHYAPVKEPYPLSGVVAIPQTPFDIADRCAATFAYWGNPYERSACTDWISLVHQPGGYLLPYWMGRYYGFIDADR